jgi:hypothetical protein
MPDSFQVARFIVALFTSGIFWLMFLFYGEKAWQRGGVPGAKYVAAIVLVISGVLFFRVVVDDMAWKMPPGQDDDDAPFSDSARRVVPPANLLSLMESQVVTKGKHR